MKHSGGPLDNQTWQTEWKTASLAKVQLCEKQKQNLESLYTKFDCPVAHQNISFVATAHDCETGLLEKISKTRV